MGWGSGVGVGGGSDCGDSYNSSAFLSVSVMKKI
jgi:hypothetical protein